MTKTTHTLTQMSNLWLLVVAVFLVAATPVAFGDLNDDLLHYFTFDTANRSASNAPTDEISGLDMDRSGIDLADTDKTGVINEAYELVTGGFDTNRGSNSYTFDGGVGVGFWYKQTTTSLQRFQLADSAPFIELQLNFGGSGKVRFLVHDGTAQSISSSTTHSYTDGSWYYISFDYDDDDKTFRFYIDGQLEKTYTVSGFNFANFAAGSDQWEPIDKGSNTHGVDEMSIFNRPLAQEEWDSLYNSGNGVSYPFSFTPAAVDPTIDIVFNGQTTAPLIYNTENINVTVSNVDGVGFSLYRNGTNVTNETGVAVSLAPGLYEYEVQTVADASYNAINYSESVTITQAPPINITFVSQSPADISAVNIGTPITLTYNITNRQTGTTPYFSYELVSSGDCVTVVGGVCEFPTNTVQQLDLTHTGGDIYTYTLNENQYVPATYNIDSQYLYDTPKNITDITNDRHAVRVDFTDVSTTANTYIIEAYLNASVDNTNVNIHFCDNTYTEGRFENADNCALVGQFLNVSDDNHKHSDFSFHDLLTFSAINGTVNGLKFTSEMSVIFSSSDDFSYYSVENNTNTVFTTTNKGSDWTAQPITLDTHLHQFEGDEELQYQACGVGIDGVTGCSSIRTETEGAPPIEEAPPVVIITSPPNDASFTSDQTLQLVWQGFDANGDDLTYTVLIDGNTIESGITDEEYAFPLAGYFGEIQATVIADDGLLTGDDSVLFDVVFSGSSGGTAFNWSGDATLNYGECPSTPQALANLWFLILICVAVGLYGVSKQNQGLALLSAFGLIFTTLITWACSPILGGVLIVIGIAFAIASYGGQ
jgi:hypothetical protein